MPAFLSGAVKIRPVPGSPDDVDLDINIEALKSAIFRRGLALLDEKKYEEGTEAFEALTELNPNDYLSHYNLACGRALLGNNPDLALESLERSVECGYRNLAHLEVDSDLDSLRSIPRYEAVVRSLRDLTKTTETKIEAEQVFPLIPLRIPENVNSENALPASNEEPKKNDPEVEKPEIVKQPVEVPVEKKPEESVPVLVPVASVQESPEEILYRSELQMLSDMGFVDRSKNLSLLIAEEGDLANVIHHLFE
jgi:tetratricopeptide (TPR) repeat protein